MARSTKQSRVCSLADCDRRHEAKGFCSFHYRRFKKYGDPRYVEPPRIPKECSVETCESLAVCKGMCSPHYSRHRVYGDTRDPRSLRPAEDLICAACNEKKDPGQFGRDASNASGRAHYCKTCRCEQQRWIGLKQRYGVSKTQYEAILESQDGACAICGVLQIDHRTMLHVDHDHSCCPTGKSCGQCIRGLLCDICNRGLGYFKDDPESLAAAIRYLTERSRVVI